MQSATSRIGWVVNLRLRFAEPHALHGNKTAIN